MKFTTSSRSKVDSKVLFLLKHLLHVDILVPGPYGSTSRSNQMPRPRYTKASPQLKEALMEAAIEEFAKRGYEAASLNRIIREAGLSKGSFYYYFDDKADLAATVMVQVSQRLMPSLDLDAIADVAGFWVAMDRFGRDSLELTARNPTLLEATSKLGVAYLEHPEFAQKMREHLGEIMGLALAAWRRGQELGAVRKDLSVEVLMAIMTGTKEALFKVRFPRDRSLTVEELDELTHLQLDLFRRISTP